MRRIRTWFLVASVTAVLLSGEAWPQERFKISVSPLVQEAFPNIRKTLTLFAEDRYAPYKFVENKKRPQDVADGNTEPYEIVLGFRSELTTTGEAKVSMEPARKVTWNVLLVTREQNDRYAIEQIGQKGMIGHSQNSFVKNFTYYVFAECMGKAKQAPFAPIFVWDKSKLSQARNHIFFVFDGHKNYIGFDEIREVLEFGEIRLARWFGPSDIQERIRRLKSCLEKNDYSVISHEFFVSKERNKKSATEVDYPKETNLNPDWYKHQWHALQRLDQLAFFMRKDPERLQKFVKQFFNPFLYPKIESWARNVVHHQPWLKETILEIFDGSRLMTTGKLPTIIRVNVEFYEDAKDRWENNILYINNTNKLIHVVGQVSEKNLLDRSVIGEAKELIKSSGKYFTALADDRVQTLTRQMFEFRRMTVLAHDLLHQHYYNLSLLQDKNSNREAALKAQELAQIHLDAARDAAETFIQEYQSAKKPAQGSPASFAKKDWFLRFDDPKKSDSVMKNFEALIGRANRSEGGDS